MYRSDPNTGETQPEHSELIYLPRIPPEHVRPLASTLTLGIVGAVLGATAMMMQQSEIGGGALVATAVGLWFWHRRAGNAERGLSLRVIKGELTITDRSRSGERAVLARIRMAELRNVGLDTKTIQNIHPTETVTSEAPMLTATAGPEIDVARIVLHVAERPSPIRLTDFFTSHMDCVEWSGKIRSFLRSHGWTPEDEREVEEEEEEEEDEKRVRVKTDNSEAAYAPDDEQEEEDDDEDETARRSTR